MPRRIQPCTALVALAIVASSLRAQQDSTDARVVIHVDSLDRATFSNIAELLQARVPGLHIARTGDGGMRWFMRGPASVSESHPLVLVDDIRMDVASSAMPEIGTRPPLLDEIDIESVERIEVWSGAATSARHGTGSGNGVIRITTTAPRGGRTTFRFAAAGSRLDQNVTYPANFTRPGVDTAGTTVRCSLQLEALEWCTPTGPLTSVNFLETNTPFETAVGARLAASVTSGTEQLAWSGGATFDRQGSTAGTLFSQRAHLRASAALRPSSVTQVTLRGHWSRGDADLPPRNQLTLLRQGLLARADTVWPGFVRPHAPVYNSARYGGALTGRWQARHWLDVDLTSGLARMVDEDDLEYTESPRMSLPARHIDSRGERRMRDWNARIDAKAGYWALGLRHSTVATVEHAVSKHEEESSLVLSVDGSGAGFTAFALNRRLAIAGIGVSQRVQLSERTTLGGGVRLDQVRVNDGRWDAPLSRHVSVGWDAPAFRALSRLRVRASLGDVANVPMTTRLFFGFGGPGRPKAEFTREREVGFDAGLLQNRLEASLTWYTKKTANVSIMREAPQPAPFPVGFDRIEVLNRGIEASLHGKILQTSRLSWDVSAWYAYNHNEARSRSPARLALDGFGFGQVGFSERQWIRQGAPLGGVVSRTLVDLQDLDGDGLVDDACLLGGASCEVVIGTLGDPQPAYPPTSASLSTRFRVGPLTLSALLDHRSGHVMHNATMEARCLRECQAVYDPSTSFRDQAEAVLAFGIGMTAEDASFTKLREVSLHFEAPDAWARAVGTTRLEMSLAARNVATWTDYRGLDPETTSQYWIPLAAVDNAAEPLPRRFSIRIAATK